MLWMTVKMFLALSLIGVLIFLVIKFFKKIGLNGGDEIPSGGIRVLSNKLIAPHRYISLVEIGDEIYALGISPQHISFLTKINQKESLLRKLSEIKREHNYLQWFRLGKSSSSGQKYAWAREKNEE